MRKTLLLVLLACTAMTGIAADKKPAAKKTAAESAPPKGAVQLSADLYRHTDSSGKNWEYRRTPFGWQKSEAKDEPAAKTDAPAPDSKTGGQPTPFGTVRTPPPAQTAVTGAGPAIKAVEDGDSIRFERTSPFGVYKWTRKKTELTKEEQAAWDLQRATPGVTEEKR